MAKPRILQQLDGELSSNIVLNSDPDQNMEAVTKQYIDTIEDNAIEYMNNNLLSKNNDSGSNITLTNANITLTADPTANMQAATKQYVDNNGGTFQAIYGITTYEEVVNAYNQGKVITLYIPDYYFLFELTTPPISSPYGYGDLNFNSKNMYEEFTQFYYEATLSTTSVWNIEEKVKDYASTPITLSQHKETPISSSIKYYRPILVSTSAPTSSDGNVGDIWIQYST